MTEHIADGLHGLSFEHGLIQLRSRHAWLEAHSESEEQPTGSGSTTDRKVLKNFKMTISSFYILLYASKKRTLTYFITSQIAFSRKSGQTGTTHRSER